MGTSKVMPGLCSFSPLSSTKTAKEIYKIYTLEGVIFCGKSELLIPTNYSRKRAKFDTVATVVE